MGSNNSNPLYKYATEAGINMHMHLYELCQQVDFERFKDPEHAERLVNYNIYFVCQRNRVEIVPDFIEVNEDSIFFKFRIHKEDFKFDVLAAIPNEYKVQEAKIVSEFPYSFFQVFDQDNRKIVEARATHLLDIIKFGIYPRASFMDLEVLYIGQTSRDSSLPIVDRLCSHDTLQKIYADVSANNPDKEVFLLLSCFLQEGKIEMMNSIPSNPDYLDEDNERLFGFLQNQLELTSEQKTTVTEAALIRFFKPKYNHIYKDTFPNKNHSSYEECYQLDLNAVSIEVATDFPRYHFFSSEVETNDYHFKRFHLIHDEDRRKLFDFTH